MTRTPRQWLRLMEAEKAPVRKERLRLCLLASTAAGLGPVEERLLRLMVWTAGYLKTEGPHSKQRDPWKIIEARNAWCDQRVLVFLLFAKILCDADGRAVAIYHTDGRNGHTVAEVNYDDGWHLFDVDLIHQAVYRRDGKILSYKELVASPEVVEDEDHWWHGDNGEGKSGFYRNARPPMVCPAIYNTGMLP